MIDREQALEIIDKHDFFNDRAGRELWADKPKEIQDEDIINAHEDYEALKEYILNQPKVGEWIPVEERLPEIFENVLIYTKSGHYHIGAYFEERKRWWLGVYWEDLDFILAWMPLPKPYDRHSKKLEKNSKGETE